MTNTQQPNSQPSFSEQEHDTIRRGVFAAAALVSQSDPGFIDSIRESFSASKALAEAPESLRPVLQGGIIAPPQASSPQDLQAKLLEQVEAAIQAAGKDEQTGNAVRQLIQQVCDRVANSDHEIAPAESAMIEKIKQVAQGMTPSFVEGAGSEPTGNAADLAPTNAPAQPEPGTSTEPGPKA